MLMENTNNIIQSTDNLIQYYPIELSVVMEMFCICSVQYGSHSLRVSEIEELNVLFEFK